MPLTSSEISGDDIDSHSTNTSYDSGDQIEDESNEIEQFFLQSKPKSFDQQKPLQKVGGEHLNFGSQDSDSNNEQLYIDMNEEDNTDFVNQIVDSQEMNADNNTEDLDQTAKSKSQDDLYGGQLEIYQMNEFDEEDLGDEEQEVDQMQQVEEETDNFTSDDYQIPADIPSSLNNDTDNFNYELDPSISSKNSQAMPIVQDQNLDYEEDVRDFSNVRPRIPRFVFDDVSMPSTPASVPDSFYSVESRYNPNLDPRADSRDEEESSQPFPNQGQQQQRRQQSSLQKTRNIGGIRSHSRQDLRYNSHVSSSGRVQKNLNSPLVPGNSMRQMINNNNNSTKKTPTRAGRSNLVNVTNHRQTIDTESMEDFDSTTDIRAEVFNMDLGVNQQTPHQKRPSLNGRSFRQNPEIASEPAAVNFSAEPTTTTRGNMTNNELNSLPTPPSSRQNDINSMDYSHEQAFMQYGHGQDEIFNYTQNVNAIATNRNLPQLPPYIPGAPQNQFVLMAYKAMNAQLDLVYSSLCWNKLREACQLLIEVTDWVVTNAIALGLVAHERISEDDRRRVWSELNYAWLGILQSNLRNIESHENASMSNQGVGGQCRARAIAQKGEFLKVSEVVDIGNRLVSWCDELQGLGLVDFDCGLWESRIIHGPLRGIMEKEITHRLKTQTTNESTLNNAQGRKTGSLKAGTRLSTAN